MITLNQQIAEIQRIQRVMARKQEDLIKSGEMTRQVAEYRMACLNATLAELQKLKLFEEISREAWKPEEGQSA